LLYGPTGGFIRTSGFSFSKTVCEAASPNLSELGLPAGFKPTKAELCTSTFATHVFDRTLGLSPGTQSGNERVTDTQPAHTAIVTYTRTVHTAIDANDHAVDVFYLDSIELLLLAALLLLAEWRFGATPGKRLCHVRVQSLGGGPITFVQA